MKNKILVAALVSVFALGACGPDEDNVQEVLDAAKTYDADKCAQATALINQMTSFQLTAYSVACLGGN